MHTGVSLGSELLNSIIILTGITSEISQSTQDSLRSVAVEAVVASHTNTKNLKLGSMFG